MSSIEIELFAPYNEVVELTGSWNDWQPMPMMRGDDGRWRTTVDLEDGVYEYQFELISLSPGMEKQRVRVGDPTALRLTHQDRTQCTLWKRDDSLQPSIPHRFGGRRSNALRLFAEARSATRS